MLKSQQPLLVVDRYLTPLGKRPILSPMIVETGVAIEQFAAAALQVRDQVSAENKVEIKEGELPIFTRWIGQAALTQLQTYALDFTKAHLV
jgi:hypothetical protein